MERHPDIASKWSGSNHIGDSSCIRTLNLNGITLVAGHTPDLVHRELLRTLLENGVARGISIRLQNYVYMIDNPPELSPAYLQRYLSVVGNSYFDRAKVLFDSNRSLRWKASYNSRLQMDNQYANMVRLLDRFPGSNSACATFLLPKDIMRAHAIQASVPCPLSFTVNIVDDRVSLNVFFRSQDILNLALCDMYFLSKLQERLIADLGRLRGMKDEHSPKPGAMTFFVSNAFIRKRHRKLAFILSAAHM